MPDDDILGELEELSQIVEGEEDIEKGLQEIEEITKGVSEDSSKKKESKQESSEKKEKKESTKKAAAAAAGAAAASKKKKKTEEKKEEKLEEKKPQPKPKPTVAPEKAIKHGNGFKIASALLILVGFAIYVLAYYLRWNGWHLISYPPSSAVALGGTLLILAGGEVYYRGKER